MRLADHVADINAVLSNSGGDTATARAILSSLHTDGLAQVLSYTLVPARAMMAVCPQTRLDAELVTARSNFWKADTYIGVSLDDDRLCYVIDVAAARDGDVARVALALWWAARCGLPTHLHVHNAQGELLGVMSTALRSCVSVLCVFFSSMVNPSAVLETQAWSQHCDSSLRALHTFPNLQCLDFLCGMHADTTPLTAMILSALRAAAQLSVQTICVEGCGSLDELSVLTPHVALRSLSVKQCHLRSLAGLPDCVCLTDINVDGNGTLESLAGLAGAPSLQRLSAVSCGLRSLEGLKDCPSLTHVSVGGNTALEALSGLAGAPRLVSVSAWGCNLRSLDGLALCPSLTNLDVGRNGQLESLAGLAGSMALQHISARYCGLRNLNGLDTCDSLVSMDLFRNARLRSVAGVAGARRLRLLDLRGCKDTDAHLLPASVEVQRSW